MTIAKLKMMTWMRYPGVKAKTKVSVEAKSRLTGLLVGRPVPVLPFRSRLHQRRRPPHRRDTPGSKLAVLVQKRLRRATKK